jgi:hypothetical protein
MTGETWPLARENFDLVAAYVGQETARTYVWYWRAKLAGKVVFVLLLLMAVAVGVWGDRSARHTGLHVLFIGAAVVAVEPLSVSALTVRAFARALDIPVRRAWSLPLFRLPSLLDRLAEWFGPREPAQTAPVNRVDRADL